MASWISPIMVVLGNFAKELTKMKPLLPTYLHLILSAVFPIYTAAHASLRRPASAAPPRKNKVPKSRLSLDDSDDENDESSSPIEALTTSDAILFPILAGASLTALYLIIKWLDDPAILNKILGYYFSWIGTFFMFKFLKDAFTVVRSTIFPLQYSSAGVLYQVDAEQDRFVAVKPKIDGEVSTSKNRASSTWNIPYLLASAKSNKLYWSFRKTIYSKLTCLVTTRKPLPAAKLKFNVDLLDIGAAKISAILALLSLYLKNSPWYLINLSGFSFCYGSLQFMSPGTSATGSLLLSLLFLYDIYMVFFTPMMVTVATKLDVPIKLLFPRPRGGSKNARAMAMLGLGDVVIPGIMIAFALRFDLYNHYRKLEKDKAVIAAAGKTSQDELEKSNTRPEYTSARGMWAERLYTARRLWSRTLMAKSFPKPYFAATMTGYVAGMVATVVIMQVSKHAQPALLYLVPGVLISFCGTAAWRGEVKLLWAYDETQEEKDAEMEKEKLKKEKITKEVGNKLRDSPGKKQMQAEKPQESTAVKTKEDERNTDNYGRPAISFDIYFPSSTRLAAAEESIRSEEGISPSATNATTKEAEMPPEGSSSGSSSPELVDPEELPGTAA